VVPGQVQPLDCYQNERRQGESRTENHSYSRRRRIRYGSTTMLLKWLSQHFILTRSLSPYLWLLSFWKAKFCQTQTGKN